MVTYRSPNILSNGSRLHWYSIEALLGQGGFGITYLARDTNLSHRVAIKEYFPRDIAARSPDGLVHCTSSDNLDFYGWGLKRFLNEAKTLAQFKHECIVTVHGVFEANQTAYIVMEYINGDNLKQAFKRHQIEGEQALLDVILQLLDGLSSIHQTGFIHRDIKPENILIHRGTIPVLLDFGSARQAMGVRTSNLTTLVSKGYAPFEQYGDSDDGSGKQGPWTDIYALGATVYATLFGVKPVDALSRASAILRNQRDPYLPATVKGKGSYSQNFLAAIDCAMAFEIADRPQNVEVWRRLLKGESEPPPNLLLQQCETVINFHEATTLGFSDHQAGAVNASQETVLNPHLAGSDPSVFLGRVAKESNFLRKKRQWLATLFCVAFLGIVLIYAYYSRTWNQAEQPRGGPSPQQIEASVERYVSFVSLRYITPLPALAGTIVDRYLKLAEQAILNDQYALADKYLDEAEMMFPNNESNRQKLSFLKQRIHKKKGIKIQSDGIDMDALLSEIGEQAQRVPDTLDHHGRMRLPFDDEQEMTDAQASLNWIVEHSVADIVDSALIDNLADAGRSFGNRALAGLRADVNSAAANAGFSVEDRDIELKPLLSSAEP